MLKGFLIFTAVYLFLGAISAMIFSRVPALWDESDKTYYDPSDHQVEAAVAVLLWWLMWIFIGFNWLKERAWSQFCGFCAWLLFPRKPEPKPGQTNPKDHAEFLS